MDLIERQKAIDALANTKDLVDVTWTDENDNVIDSIEEKRNIIANWLEKVPTAQPEIVTCEDCRWRKDQSGSTTWLPCRAIVTPSDFYCCRAERRTDETDYRKE